MKELKKYAGYWNDGLLLKQDNLRIVKDNFHNFFDLYGAIEKLDFSHRPSFASC